MYKRPFGVFLISGIAVFLLMSFVSGCQTAAPAATEAVPTATALSPAPTVVALTASPENASTATTAVEQPTTPPEPTAVEAAAEPAAQPRTPRTELEATDPMGVMLAAGKPQLVEFFAFW